MNIRDLEYLIAVADLSHFGEAAKRCFVTQPTLSMQVKKLEEELGVKVFERLTNKRILLTEAGQTIVEQARAVLLETQGLRDLASQVRTSPLGGLFRLGIIPTLCPYLLPHILSPLKKILPNLSLVIFERKTEDLLAALHKGELDSVIISNSVAAPHLEGKLLFKESFYAVLHRDDSLNQKKILQLEDLSHKQFLLLEEGHCLSSEVMSFCHLKQSNRNYSLTSLETLYSLVAIGTGISLFPALALLNRPQNEEIIIRELADPKPFREIGMYWRKTNYKNLRCNKIAELIINLIPSLSIHK